MQRFEVAEQHVAHVGERRRREAFAGAFVSHAEGVLRGNDLPRQRIPATQARVIDTTGAGDAFSGALAASLAQRDVAFAEHMRFAALYAARSTESAGAAFSMPRLTPP